MERNKGQGKRKSPQRKSPQPQRKVSPKKSPPRKSPSRRSPSPKPIGPRRRFAPFPINYNEPVPKSQLQQLYEETLKFMKNR